VVAWGGYWKHGLDVNREGHVLAHLLPPGLWCWGLTGRGEPRHPLYLPRTARLVPLCGKPGDLPGPRQGALL